MPHRLILKVTKFQLPPLKRLGTVVKNILGGHHAPPPCQMGLNHAEILISNVQISASTKIDGVDLSSNRQLRSKERGKSICFLADCVQSQNTNHTFANVE